MKTQTQHSSDLARVCSLIGDMSVAMLTTKETDDALVSRPMAPLEMDADGALWFFTDSRSTKVDRLREVNLSFCDPNRSTYVSIAGRAEVHTERGRIEALWTAFARPWFPDGPESPNLALLKVVPESAEYWDAPNSRMVRMFALAASVVAGKPIGLGEHETLTGLSAAPAAASSR